MSPLIPGRFILCRNQIVESSKGDISGGGVGCMLLVYGMLYLVASHWPVSITLAIAIHILFFL